MCPIEEGQDALLNRTRRRALGTLILPVPADLIEQSHSGEVQPLMPNSSECNDRIVTFRIWPRLLSSANERAEPTSAPNR